VFPFLLGQGAPERPPDPPPMTDGCILRMLDGLMVLVGERLGGGRAHTLTFVRFGRLPCRSALSPFAGSAAWYSIQR
jgi:hypothetical protein